jgi:hypothetical protein
MKYRLKSYLFLHLPTCSLLTYLFVVVFSILVTGKTLAENAELVPSLKEGQVELTICLHT